MCQNRSKKQFPKNYPSPFGVLKPVFLAQFEPVVMHFGPRKNPKCFENRPFLDEKRVNKWSRKHFPKFVLDHWGCSNTCF